MTGNSEDHENHENHENHKNHDMPVDWVADPDDPSDPGDPDAHAATYLFALGKLPGIGPQALRQIARAFPQPSQVLKASAAAMTAQLGQALAEQLRSSLATDWPAAWLRAKEVSAHHHAQGVYELALSASDRRYPPLLRTIADPPVILYVVGHLEALQQTEAIAVVGTRTPTPRGSTVARRIAHHFATQGFTVVSGAARGVDRAGHLGALDAGGITVAVLPGGLDHLYPSEHRELAQRICAAGGALVSEYPLGQRVFKGGFVQRDRIQAGLSLAVVVVQTERTGGTMHTVRFAERYGRRVLCPQPLTDEASAPAYTGVWQLLQNRRAQVFHQEDYPTLQRELVAARDRIFERSAGDS